MYEKACQALENSIFPEHLHIHKFAKVVETVVRLSPRLDFECLVKIHESIGAKRSFISAENSYFRKFYAPALASDQYITRTEILTNALPFTAGDLKEKAELFWELNQEKDGTLETIRLRNYIGRMILLTSRTVPEIAYTGASDIWEPNKVDVNMEKLTHLEDWIIDNFVEKIRDSQWKPEGKGEWKEQWTREEYDNWIDKNFYSFCIFSSEEIRYKLLVRISSFVMS